MKWQEVFAVVQTFLSWKTMQWQWVCFKTRTAYLTKWSLQMCRLNKNFFFLMLLTEMCPFDGTVRLGRFCNVKDVLLVSKMGSRFFWGVGGWRWMAGKSKSKKGCVCVCLGGGGGAGGGYVCVCVCVVGGGGYWVWLIQTMQYNAWDNIGDELLKNDLCYSWTTARLNNKQPVKRQQDVLLLVMYRFLKE